MVLWNFLLLFLFGLISSTNAQNFYVAAPNTLRLNAEETIAIAVDGLNGAVVTVLIQDFPGKIKTISRTLLPVQPGTPEIFKVRLNAEDFPPNFLNGSGSPKLVSLNVHSDSFRKEITIPISTQSGYVFIQTDKPIYTPKENVHLRIIPLNEESLPSKDGFKLQIRNPNGSIVEEKLFNGQRLRKAFVNDIYKFPTYPVFGEWTATVLYGYEFQQNHTVRFQLEEYVLPTFTVELKTQDIILPSKDIIKVNVLAKYVYGENVKGLVTFRLGVKRKNKQEATFFAIVGPKELREGECELKVATANLKMHRDIGWFPAIEGSRLIVEASVVDDATGNTEVVVDTKGLFATTPFTVSFSRCLKDFKPGHVSVFEADIFYVDGRPAVGVPTIISAVADNNQHLNIKADTSVSDANGKVSFEIQPELRHKTVSITIETNDPRYAGSQAKGNFEQRKFESPGNAYVALARSSGQKLKPGDVFRKDVHLKPDGIRDIYYLVVSKGKIITMNKLPPGEFEIQRMEFDVTHEMVPSFRVVVFAQWGNDLLADSLKIDVERTCNPKAQVSITPDFGINPEPGIAGKINIQGTKQTLVGLLGVDEAVYALSKKDLLTKSKVFDIFEKHDLGCGPGGGSNVAKVLGNAGITIGTNKYSPSLERTCVENKRKKREVPPDPMSSVSEVDKMCCILGLTKFNLTCEEMADFVNETLTDEMDYENCSREFRICCKNANDLRVNDDDIDDPDFIPPEEEAMFEKDLTVRSDFRETWIFEDIQIGGDGFEQYGVSLPHSITTWTVQAVSVSPTYGICVAEPQKLVSFKKIFLHLNLPYSVVRNEQVEIQATVFNYGAKAISAVVYMYGAENLCTGVQPGKKSERKRLRIEADSAASVTFPVIPLKAEDYPIKVVVLSTEGSDVIQKTLHVVPEGVMKEINIPIKLDPTNQQRRAKRHINTEIFTDTIDPTSNLQVTAIKLGLPEGFVPGTASCSISAIGDQFGTVIQTSINNPAGLLRQPGGCGEQNMMYLAPTLYTMRYLKVAGKLTAAMEEKGYGYIRQGYGNQLAFRKPDGSYAAYQNKATSAWLTAFVMKVLCQANELVHIDENVLCSGIKWLIDNQEKDGSYIEKNPMYHTDMMGGVNGKVPMTAFTLIALAECKCDEKKLALAKSRAIAYLEAHLGEVNTPLPAAIVAYALALSDSELKEAANNKLMSMAKMDDDTNRIYWPTPNAAQDIETAGYGLMTQLLFNDLGKSNSIVNWLNTKQLQSGCFKSTQDTVIALQGLSEYAIRAQMPSINLISNISSNNDRNFHKVLTFQEDNALILQNVNVDKIGGTLFVKTVGHGMGTMAVKLRYNVIVPPEEICKFHITVNVSDAIIEKVPEAVPEKDPIKPVINPRRNDFFDKFPDERIRGVAKALHEGRKLPEEVIHKRSISNVAFPVASRSIISNRRVKRQNDNKPVLKIALCVRYLDNAEAGMSIVDVGIFSGFRPVIDDLKGLQDEKNTLIDRYEKTSRGVVFYLRKVPTAESYCFSFRAVQDYFIGKTQTSVIKVYDYYNPDATCTKFYSPNSHSPYLQKICEGGICDCAEGGCPPKNPFSEISRILDDDDRRQKLIDTFCDKYSYVWKGQLKSKPKREGGLINISFTIDEVIKEGIEKRDHIEKEVRTLLTQDSCDKTAPVYQGQTYLILGKDGQKYKNEKGDTWYRYMLDQNSAVHLWTSIREAADKTLQRDLNYVTKELKKKGCAL